MFFFFNNTPTELVCLFIYCITICICIGKKGDLIRRREDLISTIHLFEGIARGRGGEGRGGHIYVV